MSDQFCRRCGGEESACVNCTREAVLVEANTTIDELKKRLEAWEDSWPQGAYCHGCGRVHENAGRCQ